MSKKTMAELMASPDVGLPEAVVDICVASKLALELQAADEALIEAETHLQLLLDAKETAAHESDGDSPARRRMSEKPKDAKAIKDAQVAAEAQAAVCDEIRERVIEHTIPVKVRGKDSATWRTFCDAHPPRVKADDPAGYSRDIRMANLTCNIDDLAAAADQWIVAYCDDEPTEKMWKFVLANTIASEITKLAKTIANLHEGSVDVGKSRRDSLASLRAATNSK